MKLLPRRRDPGTGRLPVIVAHIVDARDEGWPACGAGVDGALDWRENGCG